MAGQHRQQRHPTIGCHEYIAIVNANGSHSYGGQFGDGRAATLEEQAKGPFLNPVEMANPDIASVIEKIRATP